MTGVTANRSRLSSVDYAGLERHDRLSLIDLVKLIEQVSPQTVMVHGYNWEPDAEGADNPHVGQFGPWRLWAGDDALGFAWYSKPSWFDAWSRGCLHTYHRAWSIAGSDAAYGLGRLLTACQLAGNPVSLVGHSLGTRVITQALRQVDQSVSDDAVGRVVFLNGAEYVENARAMTLDHPNLPIYNVVVKSDAVLRFLGALFAPGPLYAPVIGLHGIPDAPDSWQDVDLGDPAVIGWALARGWQIRGDNPWRFLDHWHSFRHPANQPFLTALLTERRLFTT